MSQNIDLSLAQWRDPNVSSDLIDQRDEAIENALQDLHAQFKEDCSGQVADYIPELQAVDPEFFSISMTTPQGKTISVGDHTASFTIQSVCKPIVYLVGLKIRGREIVQEHVGVEPTDDRFNTLELDDKGRAKNAMINAGAITIAGLIKQGQPVDDYKIILEKFEAFMGRCPHTDMAVFTSESNTGRRNVAIANLLAASGKLEDVERALQLYYQICSLSVTTQDLSVMAATFSNGGKNPVSGVQAVSDKQNLIHVLTDIMNCGMYDGSGSWAHDVGFPAKSGVGGGVMGIPANGFGIGVFSPRLDDVGNSVRGKRVFKALSECFNLKILTQYLR